MTIRIIIADDHPVIREALKKKLSDSDEFVVVGEAGDGFAAYDLVAEQEPDVVILDVLMPKQDGIEVTKKIVARKNAPRVVVFTALTGQSDLAALLEAGATAYVSKPSPLDEVISAVTEAHAGHTYLSPDMSRALIGAYLSNRNTNGGTAPKGLTVREREVLRYLASGYTNVNVAARLGISARTVERHRFNIMKKTGARNLVELVKYAIREGHATLQD